MLIEMCITFTKMFMFNSCLSYISLKIENIKVNKNKILLALFLNGLLSLGYAIIYSKYYLIQYNVATFNLICYLIYGLIFEEIINNEFEKNIIVIFISITISYINLLIACIVNFILIKILSKDAINNRIIEYISIGCIQFIMSCFLFKIKRLKNGLSFLKSKNDKISKIGMIISLILIVVAVLVGKDTDNIKLFTICTLIIIVGGFAMFDWIKKSITKYYKEKMKERTVEIQQKQIKEKDEEISNLKTELETVLQINHKYNQRISAMEKAVSKLAPALQTNEEFAEEYGDILSYINELSKEYKREVSLTIKERKLPKTNIFSIDNLLEYMKQEAEKEKIDFELELKFDINEIIENKIAKNKLETMLTDHIKDAIIAIKNNESKNRKIKVIFNKEENYQIEFYDTGIEFEIDTLLKLGLERTTTHKATGGTGIGFITTFETLKECKASLIIEEFNNKQYTKAIVIKFDNKNEYKIHSYRAEKIENKATDNRIIIY